MSMTLTRNCYISLEGSMMEVGNHSKLSKFPAASFPTMLLSSAAEVWDAYFAFEIRRLIFD